MKRRTLFFAIIFATLSAAFYPYAAAESHETHSTVRVGYFSFDGYHMTDASGHKSGYGYDILQLLRMYSGWKYNYVGDSKSEPADWPDMLKMLADGRIDMLTSVTKNSERMKLFDFSKLPIGTKTTILTVKAGNIKYNADDYAHWNGMKVGLITKNSQNSVFADFARQHGFTYRPVYFINETDLKKSLQSGAVDAILTSSLRYIKNEWILAQFNPTPFYIAVRKGNTALLEQLNSALEQLYSVMPGFTTLLNKKYYSPDNGDQTFYTAAERGYIDRCKKSGRALSAIINPERKPYSYFEKGGKPRGSNTDIAMEILSRTGLSFDIARPHDRTDYWNRIKSGQPVVILDFPYEFNIAEQYHYVPCLPYYSSSISTLSLKTKPLARAKTAAVLRGWAGDERVFASLWKGMKIIRCYSPGDCAKAVKNGTADVAFLFTNIAQQLALDDVTNSFVVIKTPFGRERFCIAVHEDENALLASIINKASASMSEETVEKLAYPYTLNSDKKTTLASLFYNNPGIFSLFVIFILVILLLLTLYRFSYIHRKREEVLNKDLGAALKDATKASRTKSDFLSRMSHDIRTPLNGIIGMTALAEDEKNNPPKTSAYLKKIDESGHFLLDLVNDILDISKVESGKLELHPTPYTNTELWDYVAAVINPLCEEKKIVFSVVPPERVVSVLVDKLRFNRIFFNLLSNAVKFTPTGGHILLAPHILSEKDGFIYVEFTVKDSGCGMSKEFMETMFQPFEQEYKAENAERQGSGLGLAITKQLVDLMGGSIKVESEQGRGSTFIVNLPMKLADTGAESETRTENADLTKLDGKRVLICEDNDINAEIEKALLEKKGIASDRAVNGAEGVEKFATSPKHFYDAILMDVRMPIMDGITASRTIRKLTRPDAETVPIIAMTANAFTEDVQECLSAGMNSHISKPVDPNIMYKELARLCR